MPAVPASERLTAEVLAQPSKTHKAFWRDLVAAALKAKAASSEIEERNRLWAVQTFAAATEIYLEGYRQMARGAFYEGWCTLEQAEIKFARLEENPFIEALAPLIAERAERVALWQTLFPYRHFISPAMRYKKWSCSICGKMSTPVEPCGHTPNKVYDGQMCIRWIESFEPLELSIVTDPVQKYSVLLLDYDYSVVQYVLGHLTSPLHKWSGAWTHKRHPHDNFANRPHDAPCPCLSKLRYGECCLLEDGVRLPHFQMHVAPSAGRAGPLADRLVLYAKADKEPRQRAPMPFQANTLRLED